MAVADVTSANVVGYSNLSLQDDGKQMTCATFRGINDDGMWLSDITVTGYQDCEAFQQEQTTFDFTVKVLKPNGSVKETYEWLDEYDGDPGEGEWLGGFWKCFSTKQKVQGHNKTTDVWIDVGESLWTQSPEVFEGSDGYFFMNAGQVLANSRAVPMMDDGKKAIGNMMCIDAWLSEVTVSGYEDCEAFQQEQTTFDFTAKVLKPNGSVKETYEWLDEYDGDPGEGEWTGGFWKCFSTKQKVQGKTDATDVRLVPSRGLWCQSPEVFEGSDGYFMTFLGPKL